MIKLLAIVCLNLADTSTCERHEVVNSSQVEMSMMSCLTVQGVNSAKEWWKNHPVYRNWQFGGWACAAGNRDIKDGRA